MQICVNFLIAHPAAEQMMQEVFGIVPNDESGKRFADDRQRRAVEKYRRGGIHIPQLAGPVETNTGIGAGTFGIHPPVSPWYCLSARFGGSRLCFLHRSIY